MKVVTSKISRKNSDCIIGGKSISFDDNLSAEIDCTQEEIKALMLKDPSISIFGEVDVESNEDNLEDLKLESKKKVGGKKSSDVVIANEDKSEIDKVKEALFEKSLKELKQIAQAQKLPKKEWSKLKHKDLVNYLVTK